MELNNSIVINFGYVKCGKSASGGNHVTQSITYALSYTYRYNPVAVSYSSGSFLTIVKNSTITGFTADMKNANDKNSNTVTGVYYICIGA